MDVLSDIDHDAEYSIIPAPYRMLKRCDNSEFPPLQRVHGLWGSRPLAGNNEEIGERIPNAALLIRIRSDMELWQILFG